MTAPATLPWFSRDLESLIHPLVPGRVVVVLAPTGTGKTLFGLNVVAHLLEEPEARIMVAATEETPRYYELLACRAADVSYADYFYGRAPEARRAEVARWAETFRHDARLHLLAQRAPSLSDLLTAFGEAGTPNVLLVDHLHAMNRQAQRVPEFLDTAMAVLCEMASALRVAIVALAQVHRPATRDLLYSYRIPSESSGLGSSKIEHYGDVLLGLSRKLRDDIPKDAMRRLAQGLLHKGESVRDYEERNTARITVLKHRMDDAATRRSLLLTVVGGKMQDRLTLDASRRAAVGDAYEDDDGRIPF
jgi:replicative DNA helicase